MDLAELAGTEVLTMADVTRSIYRSEGRPVAIVPVPMGLAKVGLSIADEIPGAPMGRDQYRSLTFDNTTSANDIDAFGLDTADLTTVADYLNIS
jgi:NADH dehydrogenase